MIHIKIDSRKVVPGDTFIAIKGTTLDGHEFIEDAVKSGASCVVVNHDVFIPDGIKKIITKDTNEWLTNVLVDRYSELINSMDLIAITGTNGKTTTAYLTFQLLNKMGEKTAYIGTTGCYIPGEEVIELPNTTPDILDLYELLLICLSKGVKTVAMETSSHGLSLGRTKGLKFKIGLFTNLTQDHLDYHKTMENYLNAKMLLLNQLEGTMLLNSDDEASLKWEERYDKTKTFGRNGDIKLIDYTFQDTNTIINIEYLGKAYTITTNLLGEFNVYNYLGVLSIALERGYRIESIIEKTKEVYPPKGRCELIPYNGGIIVVDYAHTPDAVEKIINTFKGYNIVTVFGCGGDRDRTKRPIMGSIASNLSNKVIITSDNPRTEDPVKIIDDIVAGINKDNFIISVDRKRAIKLGVRESKPGTVVLILGKGHEDYQIIGKEKHHFSDQEVIKNYIKLNKKREIKKEDEQSSFKLLKQGNNKVGINLTLLNHLV